MDAPLSHPSIPAEALARQARLQAILRAMEDLPSREPQSLQSLRRALQDGTQDAASLVQSLEREDLVEEGAALVRADHAHASRVDVRGLAALLTPLAAKAQQRREATWQLDTRRVSVRLGYSKLDDALDFDEGDVQSIFLQAFRLEGFRLALDLGKRPRPELRLELPLPAGAGGQEAWVEAVLRREPQEAPESLVCALNRRLPKGLVVHRWEPHPAYATPLSELAETVVWRWVCPAELLETCTARTSAFLAAREWLWEKGGRVEGRKQAKQIDLRPLVKDLRWEGEILLSTARAVCPEAGNPLKIHAAILDLQPEALRGLTRVSIELKADPRLAQAERFEPKLKNMYEDAVLLTGGSNITLVDEDDDEPIRLG